MDREQKMPSEFAVGWVEHSVAHRNFNVDAAL